MQMNGERLLLCKSCILSIGVGKSILCKDCVKKLLPSICLKCLKTLSSKRWISVEFADEIHFSRWDFKWKVDYDLVKDVLCSSCLSHYPAPLDTQEQFKKQQKVAASKIKIKNIKAMLDEKAAHHTGNSELTATFQRILTNKELNDTMKAMILLLLSSCFAFHLLANENIYKEIKVLFPLTSKLYYLINRAKAYSEAPDRYRTLDLDRSQLEDVVNTAVNYKDKINNFYLTVIQMQDYKIDCFKKELKGA